MYNSQRKMKSLKDKRLGQYIKHVLPALQEKLWKETVQQKCKIYHGRNFGKVIKFQISLSRCPNVSKILQDIGRNKDKNIK